MTLCGVLKDILLVLASMAIWGTPVTPLQFFGYSIALGGMIYYKLGADTIKPFLADGGRRWAEYGAKHPAQRKMVVFAGIIMALFLFMGALVPATGYDTAAAAKESKEWLSGVLGNAKGT